MGFMVHKISLATVQQENAIQKELRGHRGICSGNRLRYDILRRGTDGRTKRICCVYRWE